MWDLAIEERHVQRVQNVSTEKHAAVEIIQTITNVVLKVYYQSFHLSGTQTEKVC